jgi:acyl-CoA synthetase (AMP-forming)/AMP-acid ligase II
VAAGYLNDPEATACAFNQTLQPDDGRLYLRTGDLGIVEGDLLNITGRLKDVLIRNGVNIAAADVERTATALDERIDRNGAAAFQTEDFSREAILIVEKARGESVDAGEERDLILKMRSRVFDALGLQLDRILIVEAGILPRTTSGKVQRSRARRSWNTSAAPAMPWQVAQARMPDAG